METDASEAASSATPPLTDTAVAATASSRDGINIEAWKVFLDFGSEALTALAWPVAIVTLGMIFRRELKHISGKLSKIKVGNTEAIFDNLNRASAEAKALDPVDPQVANRNEPEKERLLRVAETSPTGAILESYKNVERTLEKIRDAAIEDGAMSQKMSRHRSDVRRAPVAFSYPILFRIGWISETEFGMLQNLRETRNRAAHSGEEEISAAMAKEFVSLADKLVDSLWSRHSAILDHEVE